MTRYLLCTAVAIGLSAATASIAPAQNTREIVVKADPARPGGAHSSQVVRFGDLNLSSKHGAQTLISRIRSASRQVCMPLPRGGLKDRADYDNCRKHAADQAVQSVGNPLVQQAYTARFG